MLRIYKYTIRVEGYFYLNLPVGAEILTVQVQYDKPQIWALVDPEQSSKPCRHFRVAGTDYDITEDRDSLRYIGTFQLSGGAFIGHLFEIIGE
jgi:hypothetical protein